MNGKKGYSISCGCHWIYRGATMVYVLMVLKSVGWALAFWVGIRRQLKGMLSWSAGITVFLTVTDQVASHLAFPSIVLTMLLYAMMSFMLLSIAWKVRHPAVSLACNVMGTLGAFAVVNFTILFLSGSFS
jgi:hypothetical protein